MDGILNVYKEAGYTSHDVVAKLRGILGQKKIGHTGTLDPAATGVLPVCCGKATKVCELLTNKDKTYQAVCRLGVITDTQDTTGKILEERTVKNITIEDINQVVASFQGEIMQVPPMYSALKVDGKKLYELAREGKEVERKARPVTISKIKILQVNLDEQIFSMEVTCSKGTYIRTLCHDIGMRLGTGAAMENLIRTRVERFCIEDALTLDEIEHLAKEDADLLAQKVISIDTMFTQYPAMQIEDGQAHYLANGNKLSEKQLKPFTRDQQELSKTLDAAGKKEQEEWYRIYDEKGHFRAIYQKKGKEYQVVKMF